MNRKQKIISKYSLFFLLCCAVTFLWVWLNGRTFIWVHDGFNQHYQALIFYGDYLRKVVHLILRGDFHNIPSWSFFLGEGGDILTTLHYYVIGDPLTVFAVFFNRNNMYVLYDLLALIRMYLAGLAFLFFCKTLDNDERSDNALVMGAISYAFCFWAIYNAQRHIFFLNPMIYLPLVLAGVEKIVKKKGRKFLVFSVGLSAISNFYFFYMIVLMTVIYVAVRLVYLYGKDIKRYVSTLWSIFISSLCGLLLSAVVLVPVMYAFLGDTRMNGANKFHLLYPMSYYAKLPAMILSPTIDFWLCLDWIIPVILAVVFLFKTKGKNRLAKIYLLIAVVCVIIPVCGQIFNGLSYMSNRWCFAAALVTSYILMLMWDDMVTAGVSTWVHVALGMVPCIALVMLLKASRQGRVITAVVTLVITAIVAIYLNRRNYTKLVAPFLVFVAIFSIGSNSFWLNSYAGDNYAAECRRPEEIQNEFENNEINAINTLGSSDEFYRYSGTKLRRNMGLNLDMSSVMFNWTISNKSVSEFNSDMETKNYIVNEYENYDERAIITTLSSVKYYSVPEDSDYVPYGFEQIGNFPEHKIYENKYPLSISYSYDKAYFKTQWENLTALERQEAMLHGVYLEGVDNSNYEAYDAANLKCGVLPYTITCDSTSLDWDMNNRKITIDEGSPIVVFNVEKKPNCEIYLHFKGLKYLDGQEAPFVIKTENKLEEFSLYEDGFEYYNGKRDFLINMGYSEEGIDKLYLAFVLSGTYTYDAIEICYQPMDDYEASINALKENQLNNVKIGTDVITGDINLDRNKLLVLTIPYSEGWSATIDGEEVSIIKANVKYMALDIPAGAHSVELRYKTPYFNRGCCITLIGIAMYIALNIYDKRHKNRPAAV